VILVGIRASRTIQRRRERPHDNREDQTDNPRLGLVNAIVPLRKVLGEVVGSVAE
jgi:hypothetical protein